MTDNPLSGRTFDHCYMSCEELMKVGSIRWGEVGGSQGDQAYLCHGPPFDRRKCVVGIPYEVDNM